MPRRPGPILRMHMGSEEGMMDTDSQLVLVVDDQSAVRQLAARVLRRQGYTVLEAEDGPAALEQVADATSPVRLLLTDVVLPGMNGEELAEALLQENPALHVVFMSGYEEDELQQRGINSIGASYITKPFTADVLTLIVNGALGR